MALRSSNAVNKTLPVKAEENIFSRSAVILLFVHVYNNVLINYFSPCGRSRGGFCQHQHLLLDADNRKMVNQRGSVGIVLLQLQSRTRPRPF